MNAASRGFRNPNAASKMPDPSTKSVPEKFCQMMFRQAAVATGTLRTLVASRACLEDPARPSAQPATPRGNTTSTVVPPSFVDRTRISPRCAITICCEM